MPKLNYNPTLLAARRLHDRGLWILPILDGKAHREYGWQNVQFDFGDLEAMLEQDPSIGIAVVWNRSPYLDLDCDDPDAEANLEALCGGPLPRTPTFRSTRGLHRLFTRPPGLPQKASAKLAGVGEVKGLVQSPEGVEVEHQGAYSVVPTSAGRVWLPFRSLFDLEAVPLPEPIVEQLRYDDEQRQRQRQRRPAKHGCDHEQQQKRRRPANHHGYAPRRFRLPRIWTLLQHVVKSVLGKPIYWRDDGYAVWECPLCNRATFYTRRYDPKYKDRWACGNRLCWWFDVPTDEYDILEYAANRDERRENYGQRCLRLEALRADHRRLCPDGLHPKRYG
jgi:hypothetical protein